MTPDLFPPRKRRRPDADEFFTGRPDRVARKAAIWTEGIDLRVIEADDKGLTDLAVEMGVSFGRIKRRQDTLFAAVVKEMTEVHP